MNELAKRLKSDLIPVLMENTVIEGEVAYYMLRGNPNITILLPGLNGTEFNKTLGHYHKDNSSEEYKILSGEGIFILQKTEENNRKKVIDIKTVRLSAGETVQIPSGYGHCLVNTGNSYLVTSDNAFSNAETQNNDYEPIKNLHGFAIYVLLKDDKIEFVNNKNYER